MDRIIVIRVDPQLLANPDADIRYRLPGLIVERSGQVIAEDGYDYFGTKPFLLLFFKTTKLQAALNCILDVVKHERVLGNDLKECAVVAVEEGDSHNVVYPMSFAGLFLPD